MTDTLTPTQRSRVMARIRGKNTVPELIVRRMLHRLGFRYRLHHKNLPGNPDIVLPRWNAVIRVNGCFFHGHDCPSFRLPESNVAFWEEKIRRNRLRDAATASALASLGWRVLTVWGCALKGKERMPPLALESAVSDFVRGQETALDIVGAGTGKNNTNGS